LKLPGLGCVTVVLPLVAFAPLQAPLAVQVDISVDDHDSVEGWPASTVDGDSVTVTEGTGGGLKPDELSHHCCTGGIFQLMLPNVIRLLQPDCPPAPGPRSLEVPEEAPAKLVARHCESALQMKW
jgi:hypothetical protein